MSTFFNDSNLEIKQNFRYQVYGSATPDDNNPWSGLFAKSITKPGVQFSEPEQVYFMGTNGRPHRKFIRSTKYTYTPVTLVFADFHGAGTDAADWVSSWAAALEGVNSIPGPLDTDLTAQQAMAIQIGPRLYIDEINSDSVIQSEWTLVSPWLHSVDFGTFDYFNEEVSTVTVVLGYDDWGYQQKLRTRRPRHGSEPGPGRRGPESTPPPQPRPPPRRPRHGSEPGPGRRPPESPTDDFGKPWGF